MLYETKARQDDILKILKAIRKLSVKDDIEGMLVLLFEKGENKTLKHYLYSGKVNAFEWLGAVEIAKDSVKEFIGST